MVQMPHGYSSSDDTGSLLPFKGGIAGGIEGGIEAPGKVGVVDLPAGRAFTLSCKNKTILCYIILYPPTSPHTPRPPTYPPLPFSFWSDHRRYPPSPPWPAARQTRQTSPSLSLSQRRSGYKSSPGLLLLLRRSGHKGLLLLLDLFFCNSLCWVCLRGAFLRFFSRQPQDVQARDRRPKSWGVAWVNIYNKMGNIPWVVESEINIAGEKKHIHTMGGGK